MRKRGKTKITIKQLTVQCLEGEEKEFFIRIRYIIYSKLRFSINPSNYIEECSLFNPTSIALFTSFHFKFCSSFIHFIWSIYFFI